MTSFKQFKRKQIAELREVTIEDFLEFADKGYIVVKECDNGRVTVSISDEDKKAGSPKEGDMIARNPKNHDDQWLVAKQYFEDNFEGF